MSNPFKILAAFLDRFSDEVEGRELQEPPPEIMTRLRAFSRGELPEAEHAEILELLRRHSDWTAWLAEEVKALRNNQG